ncbi:MAG: hypothetical protein GF350_02680 [Chitinivibrionales bacterium]|nr:hypothetical protein [Chitinivibrionales bacterium]
MKKSCRKYAPKRVDSVSIIVLTVLVSIISVSARTWVVSRNHRKASDSAKGTAKNPFATISKAATLAKAGDTVAVYCGTYRERVAPSHGGVPGKPVVYLAAPHEKVIIKGSEIWKPEWKAADIGNNIYTAAIDTGLFESVRTIHGFRIYNPYKELLTVAEQRLTLGQLFIDGIKLLQVDSREYLRRTPGSWMTCSKGDSMLVHFPGTGRSPDSCLVEITVRERVFAPYIRGLGHIVVDGFIIEHCANQYPRGFYTQDRRPQMGALGCRSGHHWIIRNNIVRHARTMGIDCGGEGDQDADFRNQPRPRLIGHHIIVNNVISNNGAGGIVGTGARNCIITGNILENNNSDGMYGTEASGMKFHGFRNGLIEGNYIRNNGVTGIWVDNRWENSRITRNVILGNTGAGIFVELGTGPVLIDNNIIAYTKAGAGMAGDGIYSHDASVVTVAHNLVYFNANFGVWSHVGTDRGHREPVSASQWSIVNNMIFGNHRGAICFPAVSERSRDNISNCNAITGPYEIYSSDTYGVPLGKPLFLVNNNKGRIDKDSIVSHFASALDSAGIPGKVRPSLDRWRDVPFCTLSEWRVLTGNDTSSICPVVLRNALSDLANTLSFCIDKSVRTMNCSPVKGVDRDFYGNPLPSESPLPGPFQHLVVDPRLEDTTSYADPLGGPFASMRTRRDSTNFFVLRPVPHVERKTVMAAWEKSMHQPEEKEIPPDKVLPEKITGSPANPAQVHYTESGIELDGILDDWQTVTRLPAPYSEKEAGSLKLAWNEKGIYGAATVSDSSIVAAPGRQRQSDKVEIYIEKDFARAKSLTPYAVCYYFIPTPDSSAGTCMLWTWNHICDDDNEKLAGFWRSTEYGYSIEFFIPFEILSPATPDNGTVLGFTYTLSDEGTPLEQFFCNTSHDRYYRKPFRWGAVKLVK